MANRWFLIFIVAGFVPGAEVLGEVKGSVELTPQYRQLNQEGLSQRDENYDAYAMASVHGEFARGPWFFDLKPEVRAVVSRGVGDLPPDDVSIRTSRRALNTRRTLRYREDGEAYFDFDRLNARLTVGETEFYMGRRPISLGVLRFFPVWNKLTLPLIFEPGPEWIENPDGTGFAVQIGSWSARGVAIRADEAKVDDLALLELRHFGQGFEAQVLAGYWWGRSAGGMAASMDIWESTLRVESLWVGRFKDASSEAQFGVGVETAPSAKWTVVAEGLFQTQGLSDVKNVRSPRSRFMSLSGRFYALPLVLYQIHALWKLNAGFLVNLDNETSYIGLGGFEYSAGDNSTVTLRIKWPFGIPEGEFGDRRFEDLAGRTAGLPSTAFLSLQHHF